MATLPSQLWQLWLVDRTYGWNKQVGRREIKQRSVCFCPFNNPNPITHETSPNASATPLSLSTIILHNIFNIRLAKLRVVWSCRHCCCVVAVISVFFGAMVRAPCCEKVGLKKGRWTAEEDEILTKYIQANGEGSWRSLPKNAGHHLHFLFFVYDYYVNNELEPNRCVFFFDSVLFVECDIDHFSWKTVLLILSCAFFFFEKFHSMA